MIMLPGEVCHRGWVVSLYSGIRANTGVGGLNAHLSGWDG